MATNADFRASLLAISDRLQRDVDFVDAELAKYPAESTSPVEQAIAADGFVQRVVMNTHLNWRTSVWGQNPAWRDMFKDLGVRNVRTSVNKNQAMITDLKYIGARAICTCADPDRAKSQASLDVVAANKDLFFAIEGPNESNHHLDPATWDTEVRDFMKWLYDTVQASVELRDMPVVGPSIWGRETAAYNKLGNISDRIDAGNLHYYTGGRRPTEAGFPASYDEGGDPDKTYSFDDAIREAKIISPNRPLWITETGWQVAGDGSPQSSGTITPLAQAKYVLRMLAESFNRDVEMTAIYTLIDDVRTPPHYHGMLRQDLTKRGPLFNGLRNTLRLFADPGPAFEFGKLGMTVEAEGCSRLPLMQKRNGKYLLTLWQDVESYDRNAFKDISVPAKDATIRFAKPMAKVQGFKPLGGTAAILDQANVSTVTAPVTDELFVLEMTPVTA